MTFDTLISFTSVVISVSNPLKTCKEASKSSVIPILALTSPPKKKTTKQKQKSGQLTVETSSYQHQMNK